jgi:hypothetical protein
MCRVSRQKSQYRGLSKKQQPTTAQKPHNSALAVNEIHNNRRIKVSKMLYDPHTPHGTPVNIIQDFSFNKVCAQWVPSALTHDHKKQ